MSSPPGSQPPSPSHEHERRDPAAIAALQSGRYGRYVGLLALVLVGLITVNTLVTTPRGSAGIAVGRQLPPFAIPLASGTLTGDADIAVRAGQGARHAACTLRGPEIVNVCQLWERGPLVLVLFVNGGGCARVLDELAATLPQFPGVQVAGVSIKDDRAGLRRLVAARRWAFAIGWDRSGVLASLYNDVVCPQINFAYPGGVVASKALLTTPTPALLRARLQQLVERSTARGWRQPAVGAGTTTGR